MIVAGIHIAAAALTFVGTPFAHMGRLPGVALDCAGVVKLAHAADGIVISEPAPYGSLPGDVTIALLRDFDQVPLVGAQLGDVLAIYWGDLPRHLGIVVDRRSDGALWMVHARGNIGRVCRHRNLYHTHSAWRVRRGCAA